MELLKVENTDQLSFFTGFKQLKHLIIYEWNQTIELDNIFDPKNIHYLECNHVKNVNFLNIFKNLRSLKLTMF